jgi:6-phosphogluconolactonase (cycloisomerase 2 family)
MRHSITLLLASLALAACSDTSTPTAPTAPALARRGANGGSAVVGAVFTQTNAVGVNEVLGYARRADGTLGFLGVYPTGGSGTGGALGSQGAVVLSPDEELLFAVNAGSDQVTSFVVRPNGLWHAGVVPSGGDRPVSVTATDDVLYVLNAGSNSLAGFRVAEDGRLVPVPAWTRSLSAGSAGGAQVQFSRDGRFLAVVARTSNSFDVFAVNPDGSLGAPVRSPSAGPAPFGFDFTPRGQLVVSDPGPRSASSYDVSADGALRPVTTLVGAFQAAPCWVVVTRDGRFAYTANAGGGSVSGFAVAADGSLTLITPGGVTGDVGQGSTPLDMGLSRDNRFLYVLEGATGTIAAFVVGREGTLEAMADTPPTSWGRGRGGLAAY